MIIKKVDIMEMVDVRERISMIIKRVDIMEMVMMGDREDKYDHKKGRYNGDGKDVRQTG